jgi:hypothetical protein
MNKIISPSLPGTGVIMRDHMISIHNPLEFEAEVI